MSDEEVRYKFAESDFDLSIAKTLFLEYAESLNFDLCFQNFEEEIADLKSHYIKPGGFIILCFLNDEPVGCVGLRIFDKDGAAEMKRLYVKPSARSKGIGKELTVMLIEKSKELGFLKIKLDTLPSMKEAISLYKSLGFIKIEPYRLNPHPGAVYMELKLKKLDADLTD
jgi:ribosomal protein S18 acetylase RimI-like enzyme